MTTLRRLRTRTMHTTPVLARMLMMQLMAWLALTGPREGRVIVNILAGGAGHVQSARPQRRVHKGVVGLTGDLGNGVREE